MFAIIAGEPAVAVGLFTVRANVWYEGSVASLDELYVVPQLRNRGIGTAIIDLLHRHARQTRIEAIEINVVDEAEIDTQRFYDRHGYTSIEPDTNERAFYYFQEFRAHPVTRRVTRPMRLI